MAEAACFRAIGAPGCCSSSVVEHSLGKGEVESSILSCSTSQALILPDLSRTETVCRLRRQKQASEGVADGRGNPDGPSGGRRPARRRASALASCSAPMNSTPQSSTRRQAIRARRWKLREAFSWRTTSPSSSGAAAEELRSVLAEVEDDAIQARPARLKERPKAARTVGFAGALPFVVRTCPFPPEAAPVALSAALPQRQSGPGRAITRGIVRGPH